MEIRHVIIEDSKRIWEIRNHPAVRAVSGSPEMIDFQDHLPWFENKYFNTGENLCFVLETQHGVVGYCRFDNNQDKDIYIISIALDPDYHGKGLGIYLLNESLKRCDKNKKILAEIKKDNIRSLKLFENQGFRRGATNCSRR